MGKRFHKIFTTVLSSMIAVALVAPQVEASALQSLKSDSRKEQPSHRKGNQSHGQSRPGQSGQRPGSKPSQPSKPGQSGQRPGSKPSQPSKPAQPSQPSKPGQSGQRPGSKPSQPSKPSKPAQPSKPGQSGQRPGSKPSQPSKPAHPSQPGRPGQPGFGANRPLAPNRPGGHRLPPPPPPRSYRPVVSGWAGWHRPTPPPAWRPAPRVPSVATILGMAFGTALGNSLTYLATNGYMVDGYQDDVVYLRNVPQINYYWPDAMLYYNNGVLSGSQYSYSTSYFDQSRYQGVYNMLANTYGMPASVTYPSPGATVATWFTPVAAFITLEYGPASVGGATRYYTTLQVGQY